MPKLDVDRLANELVTGTKLFINKQMERFEARFTALEKRFEDIPVPKDGKNGVDGKDADPKEIAESIRERVSGEIKSLSEAVAAIPVAKDGDKGDAGEAGQDGRDGEDASPEDVANILANRKDFMVEVKGDKGDPGKRGQRGEKGDRGESGLDGRNADDSAVAKILMGAKDFRDMVMGEKGDKGDLGERGLRGEKGEAGEDGTDADPEAVVGILMKSDSFWAAAKGETGEKGDTGERGEKGEAPDVSSIVMALKSDPEFLTLVSGEKGEKGDAGEKGDTGDSGSNGERGEKGTKGEAGEKGDSGQRGEKGDPGKDGSDIKSTIKDANGHLILTLSDGNTIDVGRVVGYDGTDGAKGLDGKDGISADMFSLEYDGERLVTLKATIQGFEKDLGSFSMPIPIYRGVFSKDTPYERGDTVTYGGSTWILTPDPEDSNLVGIPVPGNSKSWTLSNKRGRDGKDGIMKPEKAITPIKTK